MLYRIVYEDGDEEEIYEEDVDSIVLDKKKKDKRQRIGKSKRIAPLLSGTLSYSIDNGVRCHVIQGEWKLDDTPPQSFQLTRNLSPDEDLEVLPMSGVFEGSFVYEYQVGAAKLKMHDIVKEHVKLLFFEKEGEQNSFTVKGKGLNRFGMFKLNGTATKKSGDPSFNVRLRKKYIGENKSSQIMETGESVSSVENGNLPSPSQMYPTGVICLRGQLTTTSESRSDAGTIIQKIQGLWAPSLETILDSGNGLCNKFGYQIECISRHESDKPISGRCVGWFNMDNKKIEEKDISINFLDNSAGYYNIEGIGVNEFGQYRISGVMKSGGEVTFFRHYLPRTTF